MRTIVFAVLALSTLVSAAPAAAQDVMAEPTFATITLSAGFRPDPQMVQVVSGGDLEADGVGSSCTGHIAESPDVRVNYSSGDYPLTFQVFADDDTTLVINAPDGRWYCDDDGAGDLNPMVYFATPSSGAYDVFIGNYQDGNTDATLSISEE